jgi:hypothetical protein
MSFHRSLGFKYNKPKEIHDKYSMVFMAATVLNKDILDKSIRSVIKENEIYNAHLFINNLNIDSFIKEVDKIEIEDEDKYDLYNKLSKFKEYKKKHTITISFNSYSWYEAVSIFEKIMDDLVSKQIFIDVLVSDLKPKIIPEDRKRIGFRLNNESYVKTFEQFDSQEEFSYWKIEYTSCQGNYRWTIAKSSIDWDKLQVEDALNDVRGGYDDAIAEIISVEETDDTNYTYDFT